ncbi:MAG: hypothetical protein NTX24_01335 [Candidatus Pacearchaeota archaeon]|nr:hypothetical protein [Candidatus Pacearchaeota archaeon]
MKKQKSLPICYVLFSGGLDSRLALKLMQDQSENQTKFKIIAVTFKFPFGSGCCQSDCSFKFTQVQNIEHKIIDCNQGELFTEYLQIVKQPKFGHGSGINPCIDCRIFIINKTKAMLKNNDFIVTGEVLGERPMSQHKKAMLAIDQDTKLKGKILRPLSAKVLEETIPEKKGLIDRGKLFGISGRSRKPQMALADHYKITYPHPAGGCLLCEQVFAERLDNFFKRKKIKDITPRDISLLRIGRHFLSDKYNIIVGRNHEENILLKNLRDQSEKLFEFKEATGPTVMIQGTINKESIEKAKEFVFKYSKNKDVIIEK